MDIFFPTQTLSLLQAFVPCFTAPSFAYFQSYLWALLVVEGRKCMTRLARCAFFHQRDLSSCQFLAQTTHPHTPAKEHGKACLERSCERVQGAEAHTDHPATPPPDHPWHRPDIAQQPHQPIPPQPLPG